MKACCYQFSSCTTCPECGSRIRGPRPTPDPRPLDLDLATRQDTGWAEQWQEDYYDGRDV
jgi:hypothetical protein